MIRTALFTAFLFLLSMTLEASGVWVFHNWIAAIPLSIIIGFLVMQRVGIVEGVAWFLALAVLRGDIISGTIAIIGPILTLRVFSTRSLYALFGIGLVSHATGIFILAILHTLVTTIFTVSWTVSYTTVWLQEILLIPGLYLGTFVIRWFYVHISSRVAFKSLT